MKEQMIKDVMTVFPNTAEPETSLQTVLKLMQRYDIRHMPVMHGEELLGLVFERDVRTALKVKGVDGDRESIRNFIQKAVLKVSPDTLVESVVREMLRKKEDCAVVMTGKKLNGVFTTTDALKLLVG